MTAAARPRLHPRDGARLAEQPHYCYEAFGLGIGSFRELSRLGASSERDNVDLTIVEAEETDQWPTPMPVVEDGFCIRPCESGAYAWVGGARLLFSPGSIRVDVSAEQAWQEMLPYLLGTGLALSLHQLGVITHHVAALDISGNAVAVTGATGEGKSTFAYAFYKATGARVLSDDLARVEVRSGGTWLHGGFAQLKLCRDAMSAFNLECDPLQREAGIREKYYVPITDNQPLSRPLAALIVLATAAEGRESSCRRLRGLDRLTAWNESIYRPVLAKISGRSEALGLHVTQVTERIPVYELRRPRSLENLHEGIEKVAEALYRDRVC